MAKEFITKYHCNLCGEEIPEKEAVMFSIVLNNWGSPIALVDHWHTCTRCTEDIVVFFSQKITSRLGSSFLYTGRGGWWERLKKRRGMTAPDLIGKGIFESFFKGRSA